MSHPRLSLAFSEAGLQFPEGQIAVFAPRLDTDLGDLPQDAIEVISRSKPDHDHLSARGFSCVVEATGPYSGAVVFLPRAKQMARAVIAQAAKLSTGPVVIDGQKNDGVDSILKELRKRTEISGPISKAHGKVFWLNPGVDLSDWAAADETAIEDGFVTAPGVFSADGIDPASRLLASSLPEKLSGHIVDLGAGWGYLARSILEHTAVKSLVLVEADHAALACAKKNITDPRAEFLWGDATKWRSDRRLDYVIMNPPFHTGRAADPALGQAFIATAARNLAPSGQLWLVANRHLPYETTLAQFFTDVKEQAGDNRFKVLLATRPVRNR
ncbi:MAG: class I SAM-dependent methyltransferase [Thalassovita sp.]